MNNSIVTMLWGNVLTNVWVGNGSEGEFPSSLLRRSAKGKACAECQAAAVSEIRAGLRQVNRDAGRERAPKDKGYRF